MIEQQQSDQAHQGASAMPAAPANGNGPSGEPGSTYTERLESNMRFVLERLKTAESQLAEERRRNSDLNREVASVRSWLHAIEEQTARPDYSANIEEAEELARRRADEILSSAKREAERVARQVVAEAERSAEQSRERAAGIEAQARTQLEQLKLRTERVEAALSRRYAETLQHLASLSAESTGPTSEEIEEQRRRSDEIKARARAELDLVRRQVDELLPLRASLISAIRSALSTFETELERLEGVPALDPNPPQPTSAGESGDAEQPTAP